MIADEFVSKWQFSGGNERANTQLFMTELCHLLGVPSPSPTFSDMAKNDYVFERHITKLEVDGSESNGWIDLYKRDCFVLEAKQGSVADAAAVDSGLGHSRRDLFGQTASDRYKRGMAKRGTGAWTAAMMRAVGQADGYARALPQDHGWPPFLLVTDVGHCIDVYANFARDGRSYAPFPDRHRYRLSLESLRDEAVRKRLSAIWQAPMSLDPAAEAARVTRVVADHLAALAKALEAREGNAAGVAAFLTRLLFTMFAEDTGLIEKDSFKRLLRQHHKEPAVLALQLTALWTAMDSGGFAPSIAANVLRFNGWLFKDTSAFTMEPDEIAVLIKAAEAKWDRVEPAIFGTLLERALHPSERAKLGAHYTPRSYVERLVTPTIMEPLREDWLGAKTAAMDAAEAGDRVKAYKLVEAFHTKLVTSRVLDPACGTGNFLYIAMAKMKELEGEVLELLDELGDVQYIAELASHTVTPDNFLGIEVNPRAANVAQLVLWIGYLQWHFRVNGEGRLPVPPVLRDVRTIENRDALLEWASKQRELGADDLPVTVWDGTTMKKHALTGKLVPDEGAQVEVYKYVNPRAAKWPKADFIVGNPPFIGNKRMADRLGKGYVEALRSVTDKACWNADFVMNWWDKASQALVKQKTRSFGFVTTNSIKQIENRSVIEKALKRDLSLQLQFAIPDHPWIDSTNGASVRISMTAACRAENSVGRLVCVSSEIKAEQGEFDVELNAETGRINPDLTLGADASGLGSLASNHRLSAMGVILCGDGFFIDSNEAKHVLKEAKKAGVARKYVSGIDLTRHARDRWVVDFTGYDEKAAKLVSPSAYQWISARVLPERRMNSMARRKEQWWIFGSNAPVMRSATKSLSRFIVTARTSKHRLFQFVDSDVLVESNVVAFALQDAFFLGVLSSRVHLSWARRTGATLEDRPHYTNSTIFETFPFPSGVAKSLMAGIRSHAEELDTLRKKVLSEQQDLTLTKIYNVIDNIRAAEKSGCPINSQQRDIADRGCVTVIMDLHRKIDANVLEAYGWATDVSDAEIVGSLVALNGQRSAEERRNQVNWIRPDFQAPQFRAVAEQESLDLAMADAASSGVPKWPVSLPDQVVAVLGVVGRAPHPVTVKEVADAFRGKRAATVRPVLDSLVSMGRLRKLQDGRYAA